MAIPTYDFPFRLKQSLAVVTSTLMLGGCAGAPLNLQGTSPSLEAPSAETPAFDARAFDHAFVASIEAAREHFWHAIDCVVRDEERGMPTSTIVFPGQATSFIDASAYSATFVFGAGDGADATLFESVHAQLSATRLEGYRFHADASNQGGQLAHVTAPEDHVTVEWRVSSGRLYLGFYPQLSTEIPPWNPCIKPDTALLKSRFDAMSKAIVTRDEALFKAQWHAEGYGANLVGASGLPGVGVYRQGSIERWVLEPDLKSARNLPQNPADVWVVACDVTSLEDGSTVDKVWVAIAKGKVLGGGETRDEVQALGWRFSANAPLAP